MLGAGTRSKWAALVWVFGGAAALGAGCGGDPDVTHGDGGRPGTGGTAGTAGNGGSAGTIIFGGSGGTAGTGGDGGTGGGTPCAGITCTPGQRCEVGDGGAGLCVNRTCEELQCPEPAQRCEPHPQGGHICDDLSCTQDVQCLASEFCNGTLCTADVCDPGVAQCSGQIVRECQSNGGATTNKFTCGSPAYFTSQCQDNGMGTAFCPCEDDWDCPANTVCEVGRCTGTGRAPTCTLPPVPFAQMTPAIEFQWGGNSRSDANARDGSRTTLAPWHVHSHVLNTPVVANLDDDNGDGLINELDFPEIIFTSYSGDNPWANGVLRAVHGGGPNKGKDYFARCGNKHWVRPAALPTDSCTNTDADADSGTPATVADLDYDGKPEIIYVTESASGGNTFRILDNRGALIYSLPTAWSSPQDGETVAVANLNYAGNAEIIVGRNVYVLGKNASGALIVTHIVTGTASTGRNEISMMACPADLIPARPGLEIVAGAALYALPTLTACSTPPCTVSMPPVWNAKTIAGQESRLTGDGFCAVADVWGPNAAARPGPTNRPDGINAEVILIDEGHLTILNGQNGTIIYDQDLGGGDRGGAPNVDDFDGDGFMEIASALQDFYVVVDLQTSTGSGGMCPDWPTLISRLDTPGNTNPARTPPTTACTSDAQCPANTACNETIGRCVCLHNGWKRDSDDDSSKATSSSVFDFNGDGAAEVLYNDECEFRVYDGRSGQVLFKNVSNSRTGIENPVVADVDNDGNAEVVTVMNTEATDRCDDDPVVGGKRIPRSPNGIRVWGDPGDEWVSARRIWNQQSYHVTNITEGGRVPLHEPENWRTFNGRYYNTYRSQPRSFGVAPDLTVVAVGVSSPNVACGTLSDTIQISFEIKNEGDLRVGPGVVVNFSGFWGTTERPLSNDSGGPLQVTLVGSLEPGNSVVLSVTYKASNDAQPTLPDRVRVTVDPASAGRPNGRERECREMNNSGDAPVQAGASAPDLRIDVGAATAICPSGRVAATVFNDGSVPASNVLVRFYAGDPSQGGTALHEQTIAGPIAPGQNVPLTVTIPSLPQERLIRIFGFVDPENAIAECNEANNRDAANQSIICSIVPE